MDLNDKRWKTLIGGYQTPYDASVELISLDSTDDPTELAEILDRLWDELHHQGDVGTASYYALPHIIKTAITKQQFDWRIIGLPLTIEHQRNSGTNPELPKELTEEYLNAIKNLGDYALSQINSELDNSTYLTALSAIVTASGRIQLGKAILELEDKDILKEFLLQF